MPRHLKVSSFDFKVPIYKLSSDLKCLNKKQAKASQIGGTPQAVRSQFNRNKFKFNTDADSESLNQGRSVEATP